MNTFQITYRGHTSKEFLFADCQTAEQAEERLRKELPAGAHIFLEKVENDEAFFRYRGTVEVAAENAQQAWLKNVAVLPHGATVEVNDKKSLLQVLQ